jgi:class 3 adenylate cyclase
MTATRRLAAILAADVAGYSRLMGVDEEGTHERLKAHHRELVDPKINEHSGRIVKEDRGRDAGGIPERRRRRPLCRRGAAGDDRPRGRHPRRPSDQIPDRDQPR